MVAGLQPSLFLCIIISDGPRGSMAIISGIHLLSREKVRKLVIEKWGIAFTEVVRSMDGGDYRTTCLVCFQFQWDCIIFNRHIISTKSQGFLEPPQEIMEEYDGSSVGRYRCERRVKHPPKNDLYSL